MTSNKRNILQRIFFPTDEEIERVDRQCEKWAREDAAAREAHQSNKRNLSWWEKFR